MRNVLIGLIILGTVAQAAHGQADVALCDIQSVVHWGSENNIAAYSLGTTSVNAGDVDLEWVQSGTNHPVISQNLYRYHNGRFEQIGQSWLKHSFCALQIDSNCEPGCNVNFSCLSYLTPGCQDPYSATRNGSHSLLGPKWQVNPFTAEYSWPYAQGDQGTSGTLSYKRLQVHHADLDVAGAQFIAEGQYVAHDDAQAGNHNNNVSHRYVNIAPGPDYGMGISVLEPTQYQQAAIDAWPKLDPGAQTTIVQVPDEGRFILGYHATDNEDGTWHYEYALYNMNSDRSGSRFSIPLPTGSTLSNIEFHDVDYHSGDGPGALNMDGSDWDVTLDGGAISWITSDDFESNPSGNALRWGTLYNFRFDADSPPMDGTAMLGLFKPGNPDAVNIPNVPVPSLPACFADLNDDDQVNAVDLAALLGDWGGSSSADFNMDGTIGPADLAALLGSWGQCP